MGANEKVDATTHGAQVDNTAALIAEARKRADDMAGGMLFTAGETLGSRLAAALEAVTAERDNLAAVIEKAKRCVLESDQGDSFEPTFDILASAPGDALREHDAKVWDEGRIWVADLLVWLADARADYTGPEIEFQVATTRNLADIVRGANDAKGWLPSWRWDEFEKIAAAIRLNEGAAS